MTDPLAWLEAEHLLERRRDGWKSTPRWQAAMRRAAAELLALNEQSNDLRVPIAFALVSLFGDELDDEDLRSLVHAVLNSGCEQLS